MSERGSERAKSGSADYVQFYEYFKVAKVNFFTGEYRFLKTFENTAVGRALREKSFTDYLRRLGEAGQLHPDDVKTYVRYINSGYVMKKLKAGKRVVLQGIRYKPADVYVWMTIEISAGQDYGEKKPWALFCMRESEREGFIPDSVLRGGYYKAIKLDLTADSYEPILLSAEEILNTEIVPEQSRWLAAFAETSVYEEDRARFLSETDINALRERFSKSGETLRISYRRKTGSGVVPVVMEIVPQREFDGRQKAVLYIRSADNEVHSQLCGYYSCRDLSCGMWNMTRFEQVCGEYADRADRMVGVITAQLSGEDEITRSTFAWLLADEFGRENCYRVGENEFLALFIGQPEEYVSRCEKQFAKRIERLIEAGARIGSAWANSPERIEDVVVIAKKQALCST